MNACVYVFSSGFRRHAAPLVGDDKWPPVAETAHGMKIVTDVAGRVSSGDVRIEPVSNVATGRQYSVGRTYPNTHSK